MIISNRQNRQEIYFSKSCGLLIVFSVCLNNTTPKGYATKSNICCFIYLFLFKSYQNFIKDSCLSQNLKSLFSKKIQTLTG